MTASSGSGVTSAKTRTFGGGQVAADLVDQPALLARPVGDDDGADGVDRAEVRQRARIEVDPTGRGPEPLRRYPPPGQRLDVEQVPVVHVVRGVRAAPGAAAQRQGRDERVVDPAQRPHCGRGVDQDPSCPDGLRVRGDDGLVLGVDRRGVAQPAVLGDEHRGVDPVPRVRRPDQPQDGHQLLPDQRVLGQRAEIGREQGEQDLGGRVDGEAGSQGELRGGLPERGGIDPVALAEGEAGQLGRLRVGEEGRPHPVELGHHLVEDRLVDDAGLLGRADHRRVEGLRDQRVHDGTGDVGGPVHVHRRVAGADAEAGLAGGVGQLDDLGTSGGPDEVDVRVPEQVVRDIVRGVRDDLQRPLRQPRGFPGGSEDLHRPDRRAHRVGGRSEEDGVARLRRDDGLEQHGRRRVRDRRDGEHHADRLGQVGDAGLGVRTDHADAGLVLEVVPEELGGDVVLDDLVLVHPEAGLLDGQPGELPGSSQPGLDHGEHDAVDRLLVERAELVGGPARGGDDGVDLVQPVGVGGGTDGVRLRRGHGSSLRWDVPGGWIPGGSGLPRPRGGIRGRRAGHAALARRVNWSISASNACTSFSTSGTTLASALKPTRTVRL